MLFHNYPNPFRQYTYIRFDLPVKTYVDLSVYNLQGRLVRRLMDGRSKMNPGFYRVMWDGRDQYGRRLSAAPYVYRLTASKYAKARMMIMVK
jgi:flagellar hook assembly protein FlgD